MEDRHPRSPRLLLPLVVVLAAGLFFRFAHLDRKVYWNDEVWTSLWLAGDTGGEMVREVADGRELSAPDLGRYQRLAPGRGVASTLRALAHDDPKQPPLYYLLLRLWAGLCGDSVQAVRCLSALLSLLVFPALYVLCRELLGSRRSAWMAVALMAVSPFHLLYAQEARPYSLWTVTILLASAALLRALRIGSARSWLIYAATVALGLYTHALFTGVMLAHVVYVAATAPRASAGAGWRLPPQIAHVLLAALLGLLAFAPWGLVLLARLRTLAANSSWAAVPVGFGSALRSWARGFGAIFVDVDAFLQTAKEAGAAPTGPLLLPILALLAATLLFIGFCLFTLCRRTPPRIWLFAVTLVGSSVLLLVLPDLVYGGRRSLPARYWTPAYLAVQLAVAHVLASHLASPARWRRKLGQGATATLMLAGALSCAINARSQTGWTKEFSSANVAVARVLNQAARPLLITDTSSYNPRNVVSLSYLLNPRVRLRILHPPYALQMPAGFSEVYVFHPSPTLRRAIEMSAGYRLERVCGEGSLWRIPQTAQVVRRL